MFSRVSPRTLLLASAAALLSQVAMADDPEAAPVCAFGGPYNAECAGAATAVPVDGSGSFDPDGTAYTVAWFEECPFGFVDDPTSVQANYIIDMTGQCFRQCFLVLRVTSGGQMTPCAGWVTVTDTTAPVLNLPSNVIGPWGIDTTVLSTGLAGAADLCDPAPTTNYFDTIIPSQGPGHEQTIIRTWTATDRCGFVSQLDQTITLTSPSADSAFGLEFDTNNCPDVLDRATQGSRLTLTLLGRPNLTMNQVNRNTVKLSRQADPTNFVVPTNPFQFSAQQVSVFAATSFGDCNPAGNDGRGDLRFQFNYALADAALGLAAEPAGTVVPIQLFGFRTNGTPWIAYGELTVQ